MSEESMDWLNTMTLIGFTAERGKAWHWREGASNHFEGAIPPEKIIELLNKAHAVERPVFTAVGGDVFQIPERKAIVLPEMGNHVAYIPTDDYQIHQYRETLFDKLNALVNGVGFASAGLLKNGARAWVQLEKPSNDEAAGIKYRAGLLAASSLDGSLATFFKPTGTFVVCDNTLAWAIGERVSDKVKVKHTRLSLATLQDSGQAIEALQRIAETMGYNIEAAARRVVTEAQFQAFLEKLVPMPAHGEVGTFRGITLAENKRADIANLYHNDERAAPWAGSALGVMQAVNTYNNHEATIRNAEHRAERVADNLVTGKIASLDSLAWETLNKVLVAA
jgi:phage/plasmid-like protein (TIGR03299 family)